MPEVPRFGWRTLVASTVIAALAALMVIVLFSGGDGDGDGGGPDPTVELVADPVFTEFDGTEVPLSSLDGKPTLINFFGSQCVPCITEMPALEEVHQELGDQIVFFGLALQDRHDAALELIESTGITYRAAQDDGQIAALFDAQRLPTTVLLDARGNVVATHLGQLDADEIRELIADELGIRP